MRHSILVIRQGGFNFGWRGTTARFFALAAGLKPYGWDTVLLAERKPFLKYEGTEQERIFPGKVIHTPFGLSNIPPGFKRLYRLGLGLLNRKAEYFKKVELYWPSRVVEWCAKKISRPDIVWATTTGSRCGLIAGQNLAKLYSCPLIIEFRDPITVPDLDGSLEQYLISCLEASSAIITTTQAYAHHLIHIYPELSEKILTVYSSYDDKLLTVSSKFNYGNKIMFLHAGLIHGGKDRNARSFVRAIVKAHELEPLCKGNIVLRLVGGDVSNHAGGAKEAVELARKLNIPEAVQSLPELHPIELNNEVINADVLVVIKFPSSDYDMQIPGKLFTYLGYRKPILGIMKKTEAADIITRSGLGVIVNHDDVDGMATQIVELWRNRNHLQDIYKPNLDYIRQFSRGSMIKQVNDILTSLSKVG